MTPRLTENRSSILLHSIVIVLLLLAAGPTALADQGLDQELETGTTIFSDTVDVPIVSVEVLVTDNKGRPVSGLTAADFEVLDNGEKVAITHFQAPPETTQQETRSQASAFVAQPLSVIVYYNNQTIDTAHRRSVLNGVRNFLTSRQLAEQTRLRIMLVSFDKSLKIRVPFTTDVDKVLAGLDEISQIASSNAEHEKMSIRRQIESARKSHEKRALLHIVSAFAQKETMRIGTEIAAIEQLTRSLGGLEGHKALLYLGSAIPIFPGQDLYKAYEAQFGSSADIRFKAEENQLLAALEDLVQEANSQRVSFFTLDALRHVATLSQYSPAASGVSRRGPAVPSAMLSVAEAAHYLAETTGGRTLPSLSHLDEDLDEVVSEIAGSYSMAFTPPHFGDGKYHTLKVKTRVKSVQLRYREGYLDSSDLEQIKNSTLVAAVHGIAEDPIGIEVAESRREPVGKGIYSLTVLVKVPFSSLALIPGRLASEGRLSLYFTVSSADGSRVSEVGHLEFPVKVDSAEASRTDRFGVFPATITIREGRQRVAVGLLDEISGVKATRVFEVDNKAP